MLLGFFNLVTGVPPVVAAGELVFEDDFSNDLSQWQVTRGLPSIWQLVDGVLEGNLLTTSTISELVPQSSLWQAEWRNYSLELDIQPLAGVDRNLAWGYQDPLNWYEIHFLPDFFQLAKLRNGQLAWSESGEFNLLTPGVWHHLRLDAAGGQIQIWLDGVEVARVTDPMYQENLGTIALKIGSGSVAPVRMKFDNVKVRLLADPRDVDLVVPKVRQDDPVWAEEIYDSAQVWAGSQAKSISRWGCALTSAVMVLRHYGFDYLAADLPLTPASLNAWLKAQPDGYLGQGWVNWFAIVRLVRELLPVWSTLAKPLPQLKYSYQSWLSWETTGLSLVKTKLEQFQPVILELPGHFVVAQGLINQSSDLLINDPARSGTSLAALGQQPISGRFWLPIYDGKLVSLGYWLVKLPKGLSLKIFDESGNLLPYSWLSQDLPGAEADQTLESDGSVLVWENPPTGGFSLELDIASGNSDEDGGVLPVAVLPEWNPVDLELWVYDDQVRPTKLNLTTDLGTDKAFWWLQTSPEDPPVIFPGLNWTEWRRVAYDLNLRGLLSTLTWLRVNYLASLAELMAGLETNYQPDEISARYARWLDQILSLEFNKIEAITSRSETQSKSLAAIKHLRALLTTRWLQP